MNESKSDIASTVVMDDQRIYDKFGRPFSNDQAITLGCFTSHIDKKTGKTIGHFPQEHYEGYFDDEMYIDEGDEGDEGDDGEKALVEGMALNFISDTEESKKTEDPDVEEEDEDEVSVAIRAFEGLAANWWKDEARDYEETYNESDDDDFFDPADIPTADLKEHNYRDLRVLKDYFDELFSLL